MELNDYLPFVVATIIMIASPGPSVLLTIAHSISYGWKRALSTVAGATVGVAFQLIIAAIGLTSLLNSMANAFEWLRWTGAVYLVYLGIKQWQSTKESLDLQTQITPNAKLFVQGLIITIPNPKSLIFIAAFLPQFIDTNRPLLTQFFYIVPTFLLITFIVTSIWVIFAGKARGLFQNEKAYQLLLRVAAVLMVLAGLGLALACRGS
jgi:homoserine/homoserine lactone efflux protein